MIDFWVSSAENLPSADPNGLSDPYTRVQSKALGKEYYLAKTKTMFKTLDPVWDSNYSNTMKIPFVCVDDLSLKIYDYDRMSKDDFLGSADVPLTLDNNDQELTFPIAVQKATKGPPNIVFKYRLPTENFPSDPNFKTFTTLYVYLTYPVPATTPKGVSPVNLTAFQYIITDQVNSYPLTSSDTTQRSWCQVSDGPDHYGPTGFTTVIKFLIKNIPKTESFIVFYIHSSDYDGDITLNIAGAEEFKKNKYVQIKSPDSYKVINTSTIHVSPRTISSCPITLHFDSGKVNF
ncbi:C2 and GRAM domain-containing protein [Histomonas meleagridis]|uniref:C2 and GRAM domain-containing protein n=1 Tax=Histomonas meleagridis TaxID=135588 RepID=UPI003559D0CF|nr:C2 and GRAM domain-containing protein [Histomonas meleagridis]KAH0805073.1 C2 and GRAM domain-containing protein [Histomonas meleagridis]